MNSYKKASLKIAFEWKSIIQSYNLAKWLMSDRLRNNALQMMPQKGNQLHKKIVTKLSNNQKKIQLRKKYQNNGKNEMRKQFPQILTLIQTHRQLIVNLQFSLLLLPATQTVMTTNYHFIITLSEKILFMENPSSNEEGIDIHQQKSNELFASSKIAEYQIRNAHL
ncbi:hypothetical protein FGO68_gene12692 [Halteria grandinella]|uniref:Uncharacterized protein n=1 Tax=Halteria grandinella TaxID=5974 RepID=A0A8J8P2J5_HALGN|nr:hypothetical protein FGO68_gene12692 [Halteria grandinella]